VHINFSLTTLRILFLTSNDAEWKKQIHKHDEEYMLKSKLKQLKDDSKARDDLAKGKTRG
jgi:hypothetical protein